MEWAVQEELLFRGVTYCVSLNVHEETEQQSSVTVQVQSVDTADQWRATYDKQYIEELTHKTGNFKQFDIFVNMLENAITEASESVSLELLTYSDLETLRSHKSSKSHPHPVTSSVTGAAKKADLAAKRYLILVYSVEFDRIHYPLPLPYMGKPDPVLLQNEIRSLKQQLQSVDSTNKANGGRNHEWDSSNSAAATISKLKHMVDDLRAEKEGIVREFELYKKEVRESTKSSVAAKEMKVLKGVIKSLEAELLREKSRHQKTVSKLNQDYNHLLNEVEEAKSSERSLRLRLKNLSAELSHYKHKPQMQPQRKRSTNSVGDEGDGVDTAKYLNSKHALAPSSLHSRRSRSRERAAVGDDSGSAKISRGRTSSLERKKLPPPPTTSASLNRSRSRSPSGNNNTWGATRRSRFDPTSYIKEKAEKERESQLRRSLERLPQNRRRSSDKASTNGRAAAGRSNSADRSRRQPMRSGFSSGEESDTSYRSMASRTSSQRSFGRAKRDRNVGGTNYTTAALNGRQTVSTRRGKGVETGNLSHRRRSTASEDPHSGDEQEPETSVGILNRSTDLEDIDARLNALQEFMKLNL